MRILAFLIFSFSSLLIGCEQEQNITKVIEADARFTLLAEKVEQLNAKRREDDAKLAKRRDASEEVHHTEMFQKQILKLFDTFQQLRTQGANLASFDAGEDGFPAYAYAYEELTEQFVRFVEIHLFPRDWKQLIAQESSP